MNLAEVARVPHAPLVLDQHRSLDHYQFVLPVNELSFYCDGKGIPLQYAFAQPTSWDLGTRCRTHSWRKVFFLKKACVNMLVWSRFWVKQNLNRSYLD